MLGPSGNPFALVVSMGEGRGETAAAILIVDEIVGLGGG